MKVVLGIGNPGSKYASTRHNAGFRVVDAVAAKFSTSCLASNMFLAKSRFKAQVSEVVIGTEKVVLVKPQTFVNLSGESARAVCDFYDLTVSELLVVADDINIPLGTIRIRRKGSSGGHNGLKSLIKHMGTNEFTRLRVGVGRPSQLDEDDRVVGHVLGKYSADELGLANDCEARSAEAVIDWVKNGVESCMNRFNRAEREEG